MYKNYNMAQLTLAIETEIAFVKDDVFNRINHLVKTILNEYFHSRGLLSYCSKMMLKIFLCTL